MSREELEKLQKEWEEKTLAKVLDRFPERSEKFETDSGIEIPLLAVESLELDGVAVGLLLVEGSGAEDPQVGF